MKRALEENDDDRRRQSAVAALVHSGYDSFEGMVREIPEMVHAFRFHPWRLLRLMVTSRALREAIEKLGEQNPRLWYECCLSAFPDFVILFRLGEQKWDNFLPERHWESMDQMTRWVFMMWNVEESDDPGYGPRFDYRMQSTLDALADGHATARYAGEGHIDRSFQEQTLLQACMEDSAMAHQTARAFRVICPFGIPPAQYCFTSQILLRQYMLEFLNILYDGDLRRALGNRLTSHSIERLFIDIWFDHSLLQWFNAYTAPQARRELSRISLSDCKAFLIDGTANATGLGPRMADTAYESEEALRKQAPYWNSQYPFKKGRGYQTELTLWVLATKIEETERMLHRVANDPTITFPALDDLQYRVMRSFLRQCSETEFEASLAQIAETNDMDDDTIANLHLEGTEERQARMDLYGTLDPLYWRVLLLGEEEDAFDENVLWRVVCRQLIDIGKQQGPDSELYKSMEAPVTTQPLFCAHCGAGHVNFVEPTGPLYAYCNQHCQDSHSLC